MDDRTAPHTEPEGVDVPRGTLEDHHSQYMRLPAEERRMMSGVPTSAEPPYARVGCGILLVGLSLGYAVVALILALLLGMLA